GANPSPKACSGRVACLGWREPLRREPWVLAEGSHRWLAPTRGAGTRSLTRLGATSAGLSRASCQSPVARAALGLGDLVRVAETRPGGSLGEASSDADHTGRTESHPSCWEQRQSRQRLSGTKTKAEESSP